ncbi:MAG: zf-HC2 domain-containing protein, partial [Candidatus Melainabacteria bacterium]|nr:zf-HC2 domain-containing protein [Candidatus Melainabacteria bacterium]
MLSACSEYRDELSSYLDAQLDDLTASSIRQHLSICNGCKSALESMRFLSGYLAQAREPGMEIDLWKDLASEIGSVCAIIEEDLSAYLDRELPA